MLLEMEDTGPFPKTPAGRQQWTGDVPAPPHAAPGPGLCRSAGSAQRAQKVQKESARFFTGPSGSEHGTGGDNYSF